MVRIYRLTTGRIYRLSPCASPLNPFSRLALRRLEKMPSHFQTQMHPPKAMADLHPDGFILTPFCPDLDRATFEPRNIFPKLEQICFQMASFGHLSVQIWIRPFSNPDTPLGHNNICVCYSTATYHFKHAAVARAWWTSSEVHLSQFSFSR